MVEVGFVPVGGSGGIRVGFPVEHLVVGAFLQRLADQLRHIDPELAGAFDAVERK